MCDIVISMGRWQQFKQELSASNQAARRRAACGVSLQTAIEGITLAANHGVPESYEPRVASAFIASRNRGVDQLLAASGQILQERGCQAQLSLVQEEAGIIALATCAAADCPRRQQ